MPVLSDQRLTKLNDQCIAGAVGNAEAGQGSPQALFLAGRAPPHEASERTLVSCVGVSPRERRSCGPLASSWGLRFLPVFSKQQAPFSKSLLARDRRG